MYPYQTTMNPGVPLYNEPLYGRPPFGTPQSGSPLFYLNSQNRDRDMLELSRQAEQARRREEARRLEEFIRNREAARAAAAGHTTGDPNSTAPPAGAPTGFGGPSQAVLTREEALHRLGMGPRPGGPQPPQYGRTFEDVPDRTHVPISQPEAALRLGIRPDLLPDHLKTLPGSAVAQDRMDAIRRGIQDRSRTQPVQSPSPQPIPNYVPGQPPSPQDDRMQKLRQMAQQEDQRRAALDIVQDAAVRRGGSGATGPAPYGRNARTFGFQQDLDTDDLAGGLSQDSQQSIARHMRRGVATDAEVLGHTRRFPDVPGVPASPAARPQYDYDALDQAGAGRTRAMWEKLGLTGETDRRSFDEVMGRGYGNRSVVSRGTAGGPLNPFPVVRIESGRAQNARQIEERLAAGQQVSDTEREWLDRFQQTQATDTSLGALRANARENMGLARSLGLLTEDTVTPQMVTDAFASDDPAARDAIRQKLQAQRAAAGGQMNDRRLAGAMTRNLAYESQQAASRQAIGQGLAAMRQQQMLASLDPEDRRALMQTQMTLAGQHADRRAELERALMGLRAQREENDLNRKSDTTQAGLDRANALAVARVQAGQNDKWTNPEWGYFSAVQDGAINVSPAEKRWLEAEAKRQVGMSSNVVPSSDPGDSRDPIQAARDAASLAGGDFGQAMGLPQNPTAADVYRGLDAYVQKHGSLPPERQQEVRNLLDKMATAQGTDFNADSWTMPYGQYDQFIQRKTVEYMRGGLPFSDAQAKAQSDADATFPADAPRNFMEWVNPPFIRRMVR